MSSPLEIFIGSVDLNPSNVAETAFTAPTQPDLTSIQDSLDIKLKRSDLVHVLANMRTSNCFVSTDDCTFQDNAATASAVFSGLPSGYELGSAMTDSTGLPAGTSYTTSDDATLIDLSSQNETVPDAATAPQRGALMRTLLPRLGRSSGLLPNGLGNVDTVKGLLVAAGLDNLSKWVRADAAADAFTLKDGVTNTSFNTLMTVGAGTTNTVTHHLENGATGAVDGELGHEVMAALINASHPDATNTAEDGAAVGTNLWQKDANDNVSLVNCPDDGVVLTVVVKSSLEVNLSRSDDITGDQDPNDTGSLKCDTYPSSAISAVDGASADANRVLMKVNIAFTEGAVPVEVQNDAGYWYPVYEAAEHGVSGTQVLGGTTYYTDLTVPSSTNAAGRSSPAGLITLIDKRSAPVTNQFLVMSLQNSWVSDGPSMTTAGNAYNPFSSSTPAKWLNQIAVGNSRTTTPTTQYYGGSGISGAAHVVYKFDTLEQGDMDKIADVKTKLDANTLGAGDYILRYEFNTNPAYQYNFPDAGQTMTIGSALPTHAAGAAPSYPDTMFGISSFSVDGSNNMSITVFNNLGYENTANKDSSPADASPAVYAAIWEYEEYVPASHDPIAAVTTSANINNASSRNLLASSNGMTSNMSMSTYNSQRVHQQFALSGIKMNKWVGHVKVLAKPFESVTVTATDAEIQAILGASLDSATKKYIAVIDPPGKPSWGIGLGDYEQETSIINTTYSLSDGVVKSPPDGSWNGSSYDLADFQMSLGAAFASDVNQAAVVQMQTDARAAIHATQVRQWHADFIADAAAYNTALEGLTIGTSSGPAADTNAADAGTYDFIAESIAYDGATKTITGTARHQSASDTTTARTVLGFLYKLSDTVTGTPAYSGNLDRTLLFDANSTSALTEYDAAGSHRYRTDISVDGYGVEKIIGSLNFNMAADNVSRTDTCTWSMPLAPGNYAWIIDGPDEGSSSPYPPMNSGTYDDETNKFTSGTIVSGASGSNNVIRFDIQGALPASPFPRPAFSATPVPTTQNATFHSNDGAQFVNTIEIYENGTNLVATFVQDGTGSAGDEIFAAGLPLEQGVTYQIKYHITSNPGGKHAWNQIVNFGSSSNNFKMAYMYLDQATAAAATGDGSVVDTGNFLNVDIWSRNFTIA